MRRWLVLTALAALLPAALACGCCERNATAAECADGSELRARPDCKCCMACGRQLGETCNDSDRPCAEALDCGDGGVCAEPPKCRSDDDCASSRFCLGGVCTDPCHVLDHCDGLLRDGACQVRSHRPVCTCPAGLTLDTAKKACVKVGGGCQDADGKKLAIGENISRNNCQESCECTASGNLNCTSTECPTGLHVAGAFANDSSCVESKSHSADNDCCVSVVCPNAPPGADADAEHTEKAVTDSPASSTTAASATSATPAPGVDATTAAAVQDLTSLTITHNSTQLQLPAAGGTLTYRADGRPPQAVPGAAAGGTVAVTGLRPGTGHVFTWSDGAGRERELRVDTRPGCVTNTSSHAVGETYHMGCQSTCVCGGQNQPSCRPRCSIARGTVTDPACSERPDTDDPECCVQMACAVTGSDDQVVPEGQETTTTPAPSTTSDTTTSPSTTTSTTTTSTTTTSTTTASTTTSSTTTSPTTTTSTTSTTDTTTTTAASTAVAAAAAAGSADTAPGTGPSGAGLPKPSLIVTTKSHDSLTVAWDDFRPPAYDQGYVLQYRRVGDEQWRRRELPPHQGEIVPLARVDGLLPGTEYEARVSLHESRQQGTLGESTETTRVTTDEGCVEGEKAYAVGEKFSRGCEESCTCAPGGASRCEPRCPPPQFRAGHFSGDPLCRETRLDDCCVTAVCDTVPLEDDPHQGADGMDRCEFVHCGANSRCEAVPSTNSGSEAKDAECVCLPGFTESWEDRGSCVTDPGNVILNATGCELDGTLHAVGDEFFNGCDYKCRCSRKQQIECKPRCKTDQSSMLHLPPGCVRVKEPEPNQDCCMELQCQNTTTAAETFPPEADGGGIAPRFGAARLDTASSELQIVSLRPVDAGASSVQVAVPPAVAAQFGGALEQAGLLVEWRRSADGAAAAAGGWQSRTVPHTQLLLRGGRLTALVPGLTSPDTATVRVSFDGETSAEVRGEDLLTAAEKTVTADEASTTKEQSAELAAADTAAPSPDSGFDCVHNGTSYKIGDEFHDGCRQFCYCSSSGVSCAAIECPHHFGLKLINPDCLEWSQPQDFHPTPPNCCPEITCVDDGSCEFKGETFRNLERLPEKVTGCEVCYCEFGNVTCQSACAPVPATPPRELPCAPDKIQLLPGPNGCCKLWQCTDGVTSRPSVPSNVHTEGLGIGNDIDNLRVTETAAESVRFAFSIPPALVGLPGKTEILYTDTPGSSSEDTEWDRRTFETPSGLLDRTDFVWTLGDLKPATTYIMQARVLFEQVSTVLQSDIVEFRTGDAPEPEVTLPPKVELDAELQDLEVDTDSAEIQWRRFTEQELKYIDGIQLRYRDVDADAQVWTMTPFIHRELTSYRLTRLKPDTKYEVDIVLMPFTDKHTEMVSSQPIMIHTQAVVDRYDFNISLTNVEPSPTSVRVNWTGVPQPQYQFVNVYRIVYIYEKEREEKHTFKLAKTSENPSVLIKGLKPSSKYQVWLEAYLKNGKKRVSEVREFDTKPGKIGKAEEIRVENAGVGGVPSSSDDYYGGMVAAAIIATIAILLCLFLAFLLVRRPASPPEPTPARKNGPSYENPAFKPPETLETIPLEGTSTTIAT